MTVVPVLELGGTHVTAARVDVTEWNVRVGSVVRRGLDSRADVDEIVATLIDVCRRVHPHPAQHWVVAAPGPFDYAAGVAWFADVGKFDTLHGFDLGDRMRRELSCQQVYFVNDAEAFATGQWLSGAARGARRMVGVTLGTGVGSAWLVDGLAVFDGPGVPPGGRLDLLDVAGSPLEDLVSRRAILSRYASLAPDGAKDVDVVDVARRARFDDSAAARAMREAMMVLGAVLAPRVAAFEAEVLVIGGSIARSWDLVGPPLATAMAEVAAVTGRSVRLVPASDNESTLLGAVHATVGGR
ncbi:MAG: ROK family protein [Actinomycetota bacterium]|nr:ROK family protein [Actinomycetota bacterium]